MKIKRRKIGDRNYNLVDAGTGEIIANAVQTGEHGRDNYPWDWSIHGDRIFGKLNARTGSSASTLTECVDYVETVMNSHGIYKPSEEISPVELKAGQIFRVTDHGIRYFYRAETDVDLFNMPGDPSIIFDALDSRNKLVTLKFEPTDRVMLYVED